MQLQNNNELLYQGSLYNKQQILVSVEHLESLFNELLGVVIYPVSGVLQTKEALKREVFFDLYKQYLQDGVNTSKLCVALTNNESIFKFQEVSSGLLVRPFEPVIHVKPFSFIIDQEGEFRAGMRGAGSIAWGLEFKYPMLFMDKKTQKIEKTPKMNYSNNALFAILRKWIRKETKPASFQVHGQKKVSSFRIGKMYEN